MRSHCAFRGAAQIAQLVFGLKRVHRRVAPRAFDDAAHHRVHLVRVRLDKVADRGVALGHPRPRVEQVRGRAENRRNRSRPCARPAPPCAPLPGRKAPRRHRRRRIRAGSRTARRSGTRRPATAPPHRRRPGRREKLSSASNPRAALHTVCASSQVQREDRDAIECAACRNHALRAEDAARGLEPHQPIEGGGHAARPRGIRAEREAGQARSHRHGRSGTGPARNVARVEHAGARAVRRARAHQAGGELIHVRLADRNRAGVHQRLHHRCAACRAHNRYAGTRRSGRQAGQIDIVFDGERARRRADAPGPPGRAPAGGRATGPSRAAPRKSTPVRVVARSCGRRSSR